MRCERAKNPRAHRLPTTEERRGTTSSAQRHQKPLNSAEVGHPTCYFRGPFRSCKAGVDGSNPSGGSTEVEATTFRWRSRLSGEVGRHNVSTTHSGGNALSAGCPFHASRDRSGHAVLMLLIACACSTGVFLIEGHSLPRRLIRHPCRDNKGVTLLPNRSIGPSHGIAPRPTKRVA